MTTMFELKLSFVVDGDKKIELNAQEAKQLYYQLKNIFDMQSQYSPLHLTPPLYGIGYGAIVGGTSPARNAPNFEIWC